MQIRQQYLNALMPFYHFINKIPKRLTHITHLSATNRR